MASASSRLRRSSSAVAPSPLVNDSTWPMRTRVSRRAVSEAATGADVSGPPPTPGGGGPAGEPLAGDQEQVQPVHELVEVVVELLPDALLHRDVRPAEDPVEPLEVDEVEGGG